ncbi:MAG: CoA-binding protein [Actinobacteria bacterium]|nr:CoA-binding protein [Actinomycetota bacterium]
MTTKENIGDFLSQRKIAVIGVSRSRSKYGNAVFRDLKRKGYNVFAINPGAETIEGEPCYPNLEALPEPVDGIVSVVPPEQTERVVREAARLGIKRIWMQPGAESENAIRFCHEAGLSVIYGKCVMVLSAPV